MVLTATRHQKWTRYFYSVILSFVLGMVALLLYSHNKHLLLKKTLESTIPLFLKYRNLRRKLIIEGKRFHDLVILFYTDINYALCLWLSTDLGGGKFTDCLQPIIGYHTLFGWWKEKEFRKNFLVRNHNFILPKLEATHGPCTLCWPV